MNFASLVFLAAFAIAVDTIDVGVKSLEESIDSSQKRSIRHKRTVGVNKESKREVEITKKDGTSVKISQSVIYNDGGALTLLPAVMDSAANNRIRLLNQFQNGRGRPELANSMINPPSSGTGSFDDGSDFSANIESHQATGIEDPSKHIDIGNVFNHPTNSVGSISVGGGSFVDSGVAGESHVGGGSAHVSVSGGSSIFIGSPVVAAPVVSRPVVVSPVVARPVVVSPVVSRPVVVNPIISGGVCCGQSSLPVSAVVINSGHSHGHGLLKKHLERSVEYHRRKQEHKQHLLDKLAAKQQQVSVVAVVPVHHVHTPDCGHLNPTVDHHSKHRGLKELIAYKHEMKAQRHRNKIAAIHAKLAHHGHHAQKCPTCCCN